MSKGETIASGGTATAKPRNKNDHRCLRNKMGGSLAGI